MIISGKYLSLFEKTWNQKQMIMINVWTKSYEIMILFTAYIYIYIYIYHNIAS